MDDLTRKLEGAGLKVFSGPSAIDDLRKEIIGHKSEPHKASIFANPYGTYLLGMLNALRLVAVEKRNPDSLLRETEKRMHDYQERKK